jgi:hypothetical protein
LELIAGERFHDSRLPRSVDNGKMEYFRSRMLRPQAGHELFAEAQYDGFCT